MDIVDCQVHIGPGGIPEALRAMDALGIKSALIDEYWLTWPTPMMPSYPLADGVLRPVTPTAELASLMHPERFAYLVRVDRRDPELRAIVRLTRDTPHARALRVIPGMSEAETKAFGSGEYDAVFAAAAECDLPVFVFAPGNAGLLRRYTEKFPSAKIVIDHCGVPFVDGTKGHEGQVAAFEQVLQMAAHANVGLKWAHGQRLFGAVEYPFSVLRPLLRRALDRFGAERVMWASDIGADRSGCTWGELLFWLMDNPDVSSDERARLLGGTARAWLRWSAA